MFSIAGLHETAQVLKHEASLPDPKPEVTPMSTPTNRKTRFNHTGTVTPIMSTPETPSLSRFRFGDPGTPTGKVSEAFEENYTRDRVVANSQPRFLPLLMIVLFGYRAMI